MFVLVLLKEGQTMRQHCRILDLILTAVVAIGGFAVFAFLTERYIPDPDIWWYLYYTLFVALLFMSFFGTAVSFVGSPYQAPLVRRKVAIGSGIWPAVLSLFPAVGIAFWMIGRFIAPVEMAAGISVNLIKSWTPPHQVQYALVLWIACNAFLTLMVRNRFVVVAGNALAVLNGRVAYTGETFRRWPFCPIEYKEVAVSNNVGGTVVVSCADGKVMVSTGPLRLTRSFDGVQAAGRRSIDQDGLVTAERAWLHEYLKQEWGKLTAAQVLRWEKAPRETRIQDVLVRWDGELNPSLHRPE